MSNPQYWCSMHGGWHSEKQYANRSGYCRTCWNTYQAWRFKRLRDGLPAGMATYREVNNLPKQSRPETLTECSACMLRPRSRGSFCKGCHNAYIQWSQKRRALARTNDRAVRNTIQEFQLAVDKGWVVPRHEGEPHVGKVVRTV